MRTFYIILYFILKAVQCPVRYWTFRVLVEDGSKLQPCQYLFRDKIKSINEDQIKFIGLNTLWIRTERGGRGSGKVMVYFQRRSNPKKPTKNHTRLLLRDLWAINLKWLEWLINCLIYLNKLYNNYW